MKKSKKKLKKNKDNPVPSILVEIIEDEPITKQQLLGIKEEIQNGLKYYGWYNWNIKLLNGVETNNEKPKKTKCICKTPNKCKCTFF